MDIRNGTGIIETEAGENIIELINNKEMLDLSKAGYGDNLLISCVYNSIFIRKYIRAMKNGYTLKYFVEFPPVIMGKVGKNGKVTGYLIVEEDRREEMSFYEIMGSGLITFKIHSQGVLHVVDKSGNLYADDNINRAISCINDTIYDEDKTRKILGATDWYNPES